MGMGQTQSFLPDVKKAKAACASLFEIIDLQPSIDSRKIGEPISGSAVVGHVEFNNISFHYPQRPDVKVCDGLSLDVPAATTVALVGESGCGKSTLLSLLERFYDPTAGKILLDGTDISTLDIKMLRQVLGMVSQEPVLFGTTIKENIRYAKPDASEKEIEAAAAAANALSFIQRLPDKLDTDVGDKGTQLSGGQKQRVAIARAILKNPRVLLLDEATSALDSESERVVQDALDKLMQGRTCLVVAHRISTIAAADKIVVLGRGKVLEQGTYAQLIAMEGAFAALAQAAGGATGV